MGVKYTGGPIVYDTAVPSTSSAVFLSALDAILSEVAIAAVAVTGGMKYTLQSPDGLQMKIWIQDLGDVGFSPFEFDGCIRITPTSADEARSGPYALLVYGIGYTYEAWANEAGFFVSHVGVTDDFFNFAAAILALPSASTPCNVDGSLPTVTEMWCSSVGVEGINQLDWRDCRYATTGWALSYNGTLFNDTNPPGAVLNMMPLCESDNVDWAYGSPGQIQRYSSGTGLRIDPLVSVGAQIYGQLWDAHFYTLPVAVDTVVPLTDTDSVGQTVNSTWVAWNDGSPPSPTGGLNTVLGTLFLLVNTTSTSLGNIAY